MKILAYILFFNTCFAFGQSRWVDISLEDFEVLAEKVGTVYQTDNYCIDLKYITYKGKQNNNPYEVSVGFAQKSKGKDYNYLLGITTITNADIKLTLDSINKIVGISYGNKDIDESKILDQYKEVKALVNNIATTDLGASKITRIEYKKTSPIAKVELTTNRKYEIISMMIYYAQAKEYEDDEGNILSDYLSFKIDYIDFQKKEKYKEIGINQIVSETKDGYKLTPAFKEFELIDFRYQH
jgi:hypothetical protein